MRPWEHCTRSLVPPSEWRRATHVHVDAHSGIGIDLLCCAVLCCAVM